jgi:hypothetical protein
MRVRGGHLDRSRPGGSLVVKEGMADDVKNGCRRIA